MSRLSPLHPGVLFAMTVLLAGCSGTARSQGISQEASGPRVHLPADQAAHPSVHNEWWYVVGHLRAGQRTFGYQVTIFKFNHVRPAGFSSPVSIYRTDLALTDEGNRRFYHRITYYFPQSGRVSAGSLSVRVGNASLTGPSPAHMALGASWSGNTVNLQLASRRPAMDVGGRGYLPFANGYTYYYSLTDLATRGEIRIAGKSYRVSGISWLDHQWGNWSWSTVRGWIWMALQLQNGVQLSVFDFRSSAREVRGASVLTAGGRLRTVHTVSITPAGTWVSPHTRGPYPSRVTVRVPALRATLDVVPTVRDQEMTVPAQPRGSYWEGSSRVSGTYEGTRVTGLAYLELTGYARERGPSPITSLGSWSCRCRYGLADGRRRTP